MDDKRRTQPNSFRDAKLLFKAENQPFEHGRVRDRPEADGVSSTRKRLRRLPACQQTVPGEEEASSTKAQQMHNFYANTSQSIARKGPGPRLNMNELTAIKSERGGRR